MLPIVMFIAPFSPLLLPQLQLAVDAHSLSFTVFASVVFCMAWPMPCAPPVAPDHLVVLEPLVATPAKPWLAAAREGHGRPPRVTHSEKTR
eukprot:9474411-Pyramimonas_sp.AAC.1